MGTDKLSIQICEETRIRVEFSISNPTTIASLLRYVDFGTGIIVDDHDMGMTWGQTNYR
jgi:hypothetical protein